MEDYNRSDLRAALDRLPLERGGLVFCHANLGYFGRAYGAANSDDLCEMFFEAVMGRVGGGLCAPTFTYSFQKGEVFDRRNSPSKMGAFAEWVRKLVGAYRSLDPCYSVAGVHLGHLAGDVAENSFDAMSSFFARFARAGGQILNFNFDAGSTFVHWVERQLRVPYRFDKTFDGIIRDRGHESPMRNTIWVRYLDGALEARFEAFDAVARQQGKFVSTKLGRGEMGVISAEDTYNLIAETLPKRPWFLTKAEAMGVEPDPARFSVLR